MKKYDIHSVRAKSDKHISPNLLIAEDFEVKTPNTVWVGDITYIIIQEGLFYHDIVKDVYTKKVVSL